MILFPPEASILFSSNMFYPLLPYVHSCTLSLPQLEHGKKYSGMVEDTFRMKIFTENKHRIAAHNKLYATGQKTYRLKMNKYGDMVSTLMCCLSWCVCTVHDSL